MQFFTFLAKLALGDVKKSDLLPPPNLWGQFYYKMLCYLPAWCVLFYEPVRFRPCLVSWCRCQNMSAEERANKSTTICASEDRIRRLIRPSQTPATPCQTPPPCERRRRPFAATFLTARRLNPVWTVGRNGSPAAAAPDAVLHHPHKAIEHTPATLPPHTSGRITWLWVSGVACF